MSRDVQQQPNADIVNTIAHGNCLDLMPRLASNSIDLILTDPPYGTRYISRDGRRILNDDDLSWLPAAFSEAYRVLRPNHCCISFHGWHRVDQFMATWRAAGFRVAGHIVFPKTYPSLIVTSISLPWSISNRPPAGPSRQNSWENRPLYDFGPRMSPR